MIIELIAAAIGGASLATGVCGALFASVRDRARDDYRAMFNAHTADSDERHAALADKYGALMVKHDNLKYAATMLHANIKGYSDNPTLSMRGQDFGLMLAPDMFNLEQCLKEENGNV